MVAMTDKPTRNAARAYVRKFVKQYYGPDCRGASNVSLDVWVTSIPNHMLPKCTDAEIVLLVGRSPPAWMSLQYVQAAVRSVSTPQAPAAATEAQPTAPLVARLASGEAVPAPEIVGSSPTEDAPKSKTVISAKALDLFLSYHMAHIALIGQYFFGFVRMQPQTAFGSFWYTFPL